MLALVCYLGIASLWPKASAAVAEPYSDPQTEPHEFTCEDARSKMALEARKLQSDVPTNIRATPRTHSQLQWSEYATVVAPNDAWQVEVHPVLTSGENQTPVILRGCQKSGSWPLFILERDADIYWGPKSKNLLMVNKPLSGGNQLLFFDIKAVSEGKQAQAVSTLDERVKQAVLQRLGQKTVTGFYLPTFISWNESRLLFAAGGNAFYGKRNESGPIKEYCYGLMIDTNTLQIQEVLSAKQLKARFGAECQTMP